MEIKRNILFFPDKEEGKDEAKIRMRIRWSKNVVNFNVGYKIDPDKWLKDAQRCKRNTTNSKMENSSLINSKIQRFHDITEDIFKGFEVKETIPSVQEFRNEFNKMQGKSKVSAKTQSFFTFFDDFTAEEGKLNNWKDATYKKFKTIRSHLEDFKPDLKFDFLNEVGMSELVYYLRDKKDYRDSTIEKFMRFLKWYLKWSVKKGYNSTLDFEHYKLKLKKTNKTIVYLHWDELMLLYNYKFSKEKKHLEQVRDVFCFCCFTSLRYSDVENLRKSDIYANHIEITTIKTSDALKIDLNNYSRALIEKYAKHNDSENHAFPVLSNQKMNDRLKEIFRLCELNRTISETYFKGNVRFDNVVQLSDVISTHAGRRTFISNALILGVPPHTVMQWTGHSDYSAMKPYIAVADKDRAKAMEVFNK